MTGRCLCRVIRKWRHFRLRMHLGPSKMHGTLVHKQHGGRICFQVFWRAWTVSIQQLFLIVLDINRCINLRLQIMIYLLKRPTRPTARKRSSIPFHQSISPLLIINIFRPNPIQILSRHLPTIQTLHLQSWRDARRLHKLDTRGVPLLGDGREETHSLRSVFSRPFYVVEALVGYCWLDSFV